jgi:hypothetical protein
VKIIPQLHSLFFFAMIDHLPDQFVRIYVGVFSLTLEEYLLSTLAILLVRPVSFVLLGTSCPMDRSGAPCGAAETFSATTERVLCHAAGSVIVYFVHVDRRRAWIRERRRAAAEMRRRLRAEAVAAAVAANIATDADTADAAAAEADSATAESTTLVRVSSREPDAAAATADYVAVTERGDKAE